MFHSTNNQSVTAEENGFWSRMRCSEELGTSITCFDSNCLVSRAGLEPDTPFWALQLSRNTNGQNL